MIENRCKEIGRRCKGEQMIRIITIAIDFILMVILMFSAVTCYDPNFWLTAILGVLIAIDTVVFMWNEMR